MPSAVNATPTAVNATPTAVNATPSATSNPQQIIAMDLEGQVFQVLVNTAAPDQLGKGFSFAQCKKD